MRTRWMLNWKLGLMALAALGLLAAFSLVGPSAATAAANGAGPPQDAKVVPVDDFPDGLGSSGGTLSIDLVDDVETFNPIVGLASSSIAVNAQLHSTVLEVRRIGGGRGIVEPGLAAAFEIGSDFRQIILHLRHGLRFSDGEPLTADDLIFTLEKVIFNPQIRSIKALWRIGGKFPQVKKLDDWTVQIITEAIDPKLLGNLASLVILPQHILAQDVQDGLFWDPATARDHPEQIVGTGPFRLKRYDPGQQVVLERNPYYWKVDPQGQQLPYLSGITFRMLPDGGQRLLGFASGETDIYKASPSDLSFLYQELPKKGLDPEQAISISEKAPTVGELLFAFNQDTSDPNLRKLFRDPRFRKAISFALDRERIIKVDWTWTKPDGTQIRLAEPRCSMGLAEGFWIGDKIEQENDWCHFDLAKAAQLLDQIGLKDTNGNGIREFPADYPNPGQEVEFELLVSTGEQALQDEAKILEDSLKKIGVRMTRQSISFIVLVNRIFGGSPPHANYQAARFSLGGGGDPTTLSEIYSSCGALHFYRYSDCVDGASQPEEPWQQEADKLFTQQAEEINPDKRLILIKQLQRKIAENVPVVWSVMPHRICAYNYKKLANFRCDDLLQDATIRNSALIYVR